MKDSILQYYVCVFNLFLCDIFSCGQILKFPVIFKSGEKKQIKENGNFHSKLIMEFGATLKKLA